MKKRGWTAWGVLVLGVSLAGGRGGAREIVDCSLPVLTISGPVAGGKAETEGVCVWKGIPYAAPPVGERRWQRSEKPAAWSKVRRAERFGEKCVQLGLFDSPGRAQPKGSEDCLYLNIWRPAKSGVFPVMVWIHGGGFMSGSGNSVLYAGDRLAGSQDVVVVTFNYRLGVFGFLAHPAFQKEDPDGSVGGYGMLDQIAALRWVQENISSFGGDPGNVTIFGESAGGWSVCQLLASPAARGLFHRAIQQSGGCNRTRTLAQGFGFGEEFAARLGCSGEGAASCLRKKSVAEIMRTAPWDPAGEGMPFRVHEDGYLLKMMPLDHLRQGDYNKVPYLVGSNRDEYRILSVLDPGLARMSAAEYESRVRRERGERGEWGEKFLALYPLSAFSSPAEAYLTMAADRNPGCGSHDAVEAAARHQREVYYYRFDFDNFPLSDQMGAFHGLEIPFIFGSYDRGWLEKALGPKLTALIAPLSQLMQTYWANFARTGIPNSPGLPPWPAYEPGAKQRVLFDAESLTIISEPAEQFARCELWDRYVREIERKELSPAPGGK